MQLCISQLCKLSSEYSSSVPKPINRKDVEAPDLNEKAAPTFPECRRLFAFSLFHNNLVAAWALLPPPQLEPGLVTGTGAGLGVWADGSTSRSHRAEPRCGREGKGRLLFCVTPLFPGKGTAPRGVAGAGLDVLHALLVSFAFGRAVRELEAQLEYERVRREKLESQLDDYRAEISQLRESRGKTRTPSASSAVSATPAPLGMAQTLLPVACSCFFPLRFPGTMLGNTGENCYSFQLGTLK